MLDDRSEAAASLQPRRRLPALVRLAARLPYVAAVAVLALGWYGWVGTCPGRPFDALYKALQLFGLNFDRPDSCPVITWPLHLARLLAVLVSFGLLASIVSRRSFALWRASVRRLGLGGEPVFVIGYGRIGQAIAAEFARQGRQVVAIDRSVTPADHQTAEAAAVELHEADSRDAAVDGWPVRLASAREVVIACPDDDAGLADAAELARRRRAAGAPPLRCWVHLRSSALVHRLREGVDVLGSGMTGAAASAPKPFLLDEAAARDLFVRHPLALRARQAGHGRVHVVLYGFGRDFAWVALQQVLLNGVMPAPSLRPPRVTVVTPDAAGCATRWVARHPGLCTVTIDGRRAAAHDPAPGRHVAGDLHFVETPLDALRWDAGSPLARLDGADGSALGGVDAVPVNLHLFCLEDDRASLAAGLALRLAMIRGSAPAATIAVHAEAGAADLADTSSDPQQRLLLVGDAAQAVRHLPFLDAPLDRLARALHAQYAATAIDTLPETLRVSNIRAAYHWTQKLALLGWEGATPLVDGFGLDQGGMAGIETLGAPALTRLAMLEHARWRQDRLIDGWREGPRDEERRQRDQLAGPVSHWAERLSSADQAKDAVQVAAFAQQRFPATGGLTRRIDVGWEGAPPAWRYDDDRLTLAFRDGDVPDAPRCGPGEAARWRVLIPPERVWGGDPEPNVRRAARRAALAAFAAAHQHPLSLERLSCDDWGWRAPELDPQVGCVALPPLVVGFAGPRDAERLPDPEALERAIAAWVAAVRPPDGAPAPLVTGAAPGADAIAIRLWRARGYGPVLVFAPFGQVDAPRHDAAAAARCDLPGDVTVRLASEDQPGWTGHMAVTRAILDRATVLLAVLEDARAAAITDAHPVDGGTAATLAEARLRGTPARRIDPARC